METPRPYRAVKLSVCCFLHVLYNRTFLLGDCPSTTGNRSSLFFTALPTSLHQPGCQIVLSRWRRTLIAFSKIGTLGAVFFFNFPFNYTIQIIPRQKEWPFIYKDFQGDVVHSYESLLTSPKNL
jgi:hypothetical protein